MFKKNEKIKNQLLRVNPYRGRLKKTEKKIKKLLKDILSQNDKVVFACIGTPKVAGDSFGPALGMYLHESLHQNDNIKVVGTINEPLMALNLEEKIDYINENYDDHLKIAFDACVSNIKTSYMFDLSFTKDSILPGKAVRKKISSIGDYSIKLTTVQVEEDNNELEYLSFLLRQTNLVKLSEIVCFLGDIIVEVYKELYPQTSENLS
jgi:putative sporulation protein YyaC